MHANWDQYLDVLVSSSTPVLRSFIARKDQERLLAIGYVFELWNVSPQFDLCAHVGTKLDERANVRWNSGDYQYPAGLLNTHDELGRDWSAISAQLHQWAEEEKVLGIDGPTYRGLIDLSCRAMVQLATSGLFDPSELDFNISEVNDPWEVVMDRNRMLHSRIAALK